MNTKQTIGSALGAVALSWLVVTVAGCAAGPADEEDQNPTALTSEETGLALTPQAGPGPGWLPYCARQWFCDTNSIWYATKAQCAAVCGIDGCSAEANCSLPNCTCP